MSGLSKIEFLRRAREARVAVNLEIKGNASSGDTYARGLASEGWAGGYQQALDDVTALLDHGYPSDQRSYWRKRPTPPKEPRDE